MDCIEGCDYDTQTPYKCTYCNECHCVYHRLPEKHDCVALTHAKTLGPDIQSTIEEDQNQGVILETDQKVAESVDVCTVCGSETKESRELCQTCIETEDREIAKRAKQQEEINERVSSKTSRETCLNCGVETTHDRELCSACERVKKCRQKKNVCANCSDHIPPDKELCLRCRRKEQTIDSTSPDITVTGELKQTTQTAVGDTEPLSKERNFLLTHSTLVKFAILIIFALIGLWGTGTITIP